ncbi:DUF6174 domain-containing protein [Cellulomonas sp. ICMP 17802]|uniref:DUF6174 domain-containing protein n=1 Tax=Cellulomonas sp. ICMP 17802 TaxID=3239199 RepID=UPI00351BD300
MVRRRLPAAVLCGVSLGITGCASPAEPAPTSSAWAAHASQDYTYELASSCGERGGIGTFVVTVVDGKITAIEGQSFESSSTLIAVTPTIDDLIDRIQDPTSGAKDVTYDPVTGVPTWVEFDPDPRAVDDESCYAVRSYTPTP